MTGELHDLACVVHLHSTYSDGTATVPELLTSARQAEADVVLLTDHDTLAARRDGWEGWHGDVLLGVGVEVSSRHGHYLAFGLDEALEHRDVPVADIPRLVREAGGVGFAAHPFSRGSLMAPRLAKPHGWGALDDPGLAGIELWCLTTDAAEAWRHPLQMIRYLAAPERHLTGPPAHHVEAWDRITRERRLAAIAGLDAHQTGVRIRNRVISPMPNRRYYRMLRTYALCREAPERDAQRDLAQVYEALAEGRCFISVDHLAPGRGFRFWAEGAAGRIEMGEERSAAPVTLRARLPREAALKLVRDGVPLLEARGTELEHEVSEPGVYRLEARLAPRGRELPWIYSNPIYLRG